MKLNNYMNSVVKCLFLVLITLVFIDVSAQDETYTICEGEGVLIGVANGFPGAAYVYFDPPNDLSCSNCYSAYAMPSQTTLYTLNYAVNLAGGEISSNMQITFLVEVEDCSGPDPDPDPDPDNPPIGSNTSFCGSDDPLNDLAWLQNILLQEDCCESSRIYAYYDLDNTYFYVTPFWEEPCALDHHARLYDCSGTLLCTGVQNCYADYQLADMFGVLLHDCGIAPSSTSPLTCNSNDFTWIDDIIANANCCYTNKIFFYSNGFDACVYVDVALDWDFGCPMTYAPRIYDCEGALICQSTITSNCWGMYNLDEWTGSLIWECDGDLPDCNFVDPVEDLPWLDQLIDEADCCNENRIYMYESDNQSFFYCDPAYDANGCSNYSPILYDCLGNVLCISDIDQNCYQVYGLGGMTGSLLWDCFSVEDELWEDTNYLLGFAPVEAFSKDELENGLSQLEYKNLYGSIILEMDLYPNPSEGIVNLRAFFGKEEAEALSVEIFDIKGQTIYSENLTGFTHTVDLGQEAKGIYFVRINSELQSVTEKLMLK